MDGTAISPDAMGIKPVVNNTEQPKAGDNTAAKAEHVGTFAQIKEKLGKALHIGGKASEANKSTEELAAKTAAQTAEDEQKLKITRENLKFTDEHTAQVAEMAANPDFRDPRDRKIIGNSEGVYDADPHGDEPLALEQPARNITNNSTTQETPAVTGDDTTAGETATPTTELPTVTAVKALKAA